MVRGASTPGRLFAGGKLLAGCPKLAPHLYEQVAEPVLPAPVAAVAPIAVVGGVLDQECVAGAEQHGPQVVVLAEGRGPRTFDGRSYFHRVLRPYAQSGAVFGLGRQKLLKAEIRWPVVDWRTTFVCPGYKRNSSHDRYDPASRPAAVHFHATTIPRHPTWRPRPPGRRRADAVFALPRGPSDGRPRP